MNKINIENYPLKKYKHIDKPRSIIVTKNYIINPHNISKHSFLPLIHYNLTFYKFNLNKSKKREKKIRKIFYAGHLDSHIYKYYSSELLNPSYDDFSSKNSINDCVTAYRQNKQGKSNIHFAAEVIDFIHRQDDCYIFIGDFTNFFDELNHKQLFTNLKRVLNVERLGNDWFNIYRSITKFGYIEKQELEDYSLQNIKLNFKNAYFNNVNEFWKHKNELTIGYNGKKDEKNKNDKPIGIPQGTPISAIFANVYCIDFDININSFAIKHNGLYRRYSDDFIIIIPKSTVSNYDILIEKIDSEVNKSKLNLQPEKINLIEKYIDGNDNILVDLNKKKQLHLLDYLGFTYNGSKVQVRQKSIYKFFRTGKRLYWKSRIIKGQKNLSYLPYRKKIARHIGLNSKNNFVHYLRRSQQIFDEISPYTDNYMLNQIKSRFKYLQKDSNQ